MKNKRQFIKLLKKVAQQDYHNWNTITDCTVGRLIQACNIEIKKEDSNHLKAGMTKPATSRFSIHVIRMWCASITHPALIAFMNKFNLDDNFIRSLEVLNNQVIIKRLAAKDIFPSSLLYKNGKYVSNYLNELALSIEEKLTKSKIEQIIISEIKIGGKRKELKDKLQNADKELEPIV